MKQSNYDERFPEQRSEAAMALGSNCRRLRLAKGWSQEDLATAIETKQPNITVIEKGRSNLTLLALEKLAAALGVEITELLHDFPKSRRPKKDNVYPSSPHRHGKYLGTLRC